MEKRIGNSNWWNDVHREEGWFEERLQEASVDEFGVPVPVVMEKVINKYAPKQSEKEAANSYCEFCGTRTGLHGFAFNREGEYGDGLGSI